MSDGTKIEWTDATWNIVNGCSVVSPGCTNCYAMRLAGTRLKHHPSREGLTIDTKAGPVWTGEVRFNEKVLLDPLKWRRPRKIFVCAHGDLFHESVPDEWLDRVFAVMALAPHHQFQVLTKRPERMRDYIKGENLPFLSGRLQRIQDAAYRIAATRKSSWDEAAAVAARQACLDALKRISDRENAGFNNVWLGVSVEDQQRADERVPILLDTPAAVRWLSCEPLLGPVDLEHIELDKPRGDYVALNALTGCGYYPEEDNNLGADPCEFEKIDWVVAGGESGPGARPMHPDWARSLRDQCEGEDVPFLFKQWGEFAPIVTTGHNDPRYPADPPTGERMERFGKKAAGRLLDGVQHDGYPA